MAVTAARAIFIDKDGTLVRNVPYNVDLGRVRLASGASALAKLGRSGYRVVVVSNQPGVAYGYDDAVRFIDAYLRGERFEFPE